jgi:hypothetical protein
MKPLAIVAAGATFVGCVLAGFAAGLAAGRATGAAWWPIAGMFAGLVAGAGSVAVQFRRSL